MWADNNWEFNFQHVGSRYGQRLLCGDAYQGLPIIVKGDQ